MSIVGDPPGWLIIPAWRLGAAVLELGRACSAEDRSAVLRAVALVELRAGDIVARARERWQ